MTGKKFHVERPCLQKNAVYAYYAALFLYVT